MPAFMPVLIIPFALVVICLLIVSFQKILKNYFKDKGKSYFSSFYYFVILEYLISTIVGVCSICFLLAWDLRLPGILAIIIVNLLLSFLYTYIYFLPYLVANKKNHLQTRAIYILNIFAGWTVLAWIIALIWALTEAQNKVILKQSVNISSAEELAKYKELLDKEIITKEEYDKKKKQLLGL